MPEQAPLHCVTITRLGGLGDGIGMHAGKPVFIPKTAPGDVLQMRLTHQNTQGFRGEIVSLISGGELRNAHPCPHFEACGGCGLQQLSEPAYQDFKRAILASALSYAGFARVKAEMVFLPAASRRRAEFKIRHDPAFALAYHGLRSHELVGVKQCLILTAELQAFLPLLSASLAALPFARNLTGCRLTQADSGIELSLACAERPDESGLAALRPLAESLSLARILLRPDDGSMKIIERQPVVMRFGAVRIALPPNAFLQATAQGQERLTAFVTEALSNNRAVCDLFCGIGVYALALSGPVHAIDSNAAMIAALKQGIAHHALGRLTAERRDLFKHPLTARELSRFDAAALNPPRAGAAAQIEQIAHSSLKRVAMVSCNPATFSRDAMRLKQAGFTLERALGIDQFVWSAHLEIAALFSR